MTFSKGKQGKVVTACAPVSLAAYVIGPLYIPCPVPARQYGLSASSE